MIYIRLTTEHIREHGFLGIRLIPDVHGHCERLRAKVDEAYTNGLLPIQGGDLVDRGPDSPGCMRESLSILWVKGNHDFKLEKYLSGVLVRRPAVFLETLRQIHDLPEEERETLIDDWLERVRSAPYWIQIGSLLISHAAAHPWMWDDVFYGEAEKIVKERALFGQTDGTKTPSGYPKRIFNWVNDVPEGQVTVHGHSVMSVDHAVLARGNLGGRSVFLDNGCGHEDGRLVHLDILLDSIDAGDPLKDATGVEIEEWPIDRLGDLVQ